MWRSYNQKLQAKENWKKLDTSKEDDYFLNKEEFAERLGMRIHEF